MTIRFAVTLPLLATLMLQQTPVRDIPGQIVSGTAVVHGTVLNGPTGSDPARKARVMLGSVDRSVPGVTVATDDEGRFEFRGVPAGRYWIEAQKSGYLLGSYGRTRPNQAGTPVSVAAGARLDGLTIRLVHGAALTGIVRDARGRPLPGVSVSALRYGYSTFGERQFSQAGTATTDDRGEYRIWGLSPGEFVVAATPRDPGNAGGAFPTNDFSILTAADVDRLLQGAAPPVVNSQAPVPTHNYAPVFFPGTPDVALARTVALAAEEDRQGVDVVVSLFRTARIDGVVTTRNGQPVASAKLTLVRAGEGGKLLGGIQAWRGWAATSDKQGRYDFQDVAPGSYTLLAVATTPGQGGAGGAAAQPGSSTWAMSEVTLNGDAISVPLTMQPAMTIAGRVVFDGQSPPPQNPGELNLRLVPPGSGGNIGAGPVGGTVNADGTFAFSGVTPGEYRMVQLMRTQVPWNWWTRSATAGGQDALNGPLKVAPGESPELVLTYTDRPTEISGQFQDVTGRPAPDYFIVMFPTDRALWTPGSRRISSTRPDNAGRFVMRGLPAGDYLLAAVTDLDPQDLFSALFFDQLAPLAVKVKLAEGVPAKQDLRVGKVPGPNSEAVKK